MKYVIKMSLQQMTLVKIATQLWNKKDIKNTIKNCRFLEGFKEEWQKVEDEVVKNVSSIPLPKSLKKDLLSLIKPVGLQMRAWCAFHQFADCQILSLSNRLIWTSRGSIDWKRTAQMMVKDQNLTLDARYKLACLNCLEDDISELWNRIPKRQRLRYFLKQSVSNTKALELVRFWSYQLVGKMSKLSEEILKCTGQSNPYVYALELAVYDGNQVATEFFYNKLSDEERNTLLVRCAGRATEFYESKSVFEECHSEVFHFLFSHMSEDQQMQTLAGFPREAFRCLLDWPFQPFFVASVKMIAHLISGGYFAVILELITSKFINGWTDFNYRQLCRDVWRLIPLVYQRSFKSYCRVIFQLLECGEGGILRSILKHADSSEKEELMFSELQLCKDLVDRGRWQSIEKLTELCGASKEVMVRFKERLIDYNNAESAGFSEIHVRTWEAFSHLVDHLIEKKNIKRLEEKNDKHPSKKLRTI